MISDIRYIQLCDDLSNAVLTDYLFKNSPLATIPNIAIFFIIDYILFDRIKDKNNTPTVRKCIANISTKLLKDEFCDFIIYHVSNELSHRHNNPSDYNIDIRILNDLMDHQNYEKLLSFIKEFQLLVDIIT